MVQSPSRDRKSPKIKSRILGKIKDIEPENLVFLDETGIILGLTRTHTRSQPGRKVTELKPFY
jgi:putative transposase